MITCFPPTVQTKRNTSVASTTKRRGFVFPPGHRIRIIGFINSVISKYALPGKKRSSSSTFLAKKQKIQHQMKLLQQKRKPRLHMT